MALLRLVSCDGLEVDLLNSKTIARLVSLSHKVDILESVAMQSKVLKEMLDNCSPVMAEGNSIVEEEVPLPTIHSEQLKIIARLIKTFPSFTLTKLLVIRWMVDHCDDLQENEGCLCNTLDEKDTYLNNLEEDVFFELMLAANFLDVPGLLDALAKVVAVKLERKTAAQIRQEFGIEDDLAREEVEAIQEEEEWDTLVESVSG